ncbi:hydrolase [Cohnella sp. LGH]|uniref:HAD family hydrolase n=1 Tax=Cohnella sp. LGH TaxID=1619153 RepID=UPI001ADD180F|nr:hydrolase [Cohnella sp. LGH]QTH41168.1 hydrolase [Cohnella sp. LGH]
MIFACDLDQTLIYSRRSMGPVEESELVPVEKYEGEDLSYMTRTAYMRLRELSREIDFVPTTTRIYEQYARIHGLADGISIRYAIVSNGGRVLIDGRTDEQWDGLIREAVRAGAASGDEAMALFRRLADASWVLKERYCDELFHAVVVERDRIPHGWMDELASELSGMGWNCSLQGRKVYLVPDPVSKGAAVRYVKELTGASFVFAAGDSLLDESMLRVADEAMAPGHGELFRSYGSGNDGAIRFSRRSGIMAAEEILNAAAACNKTEVAG